MELYKLTAHELHDKLVNKEVSSVELTNALYARIDEVEDKVNAYVTLDKENALAQAAKVDAKIAAGETIAPLAGVPGAIKDNICTKGLLTTCSSKMLSNVVPIYDAHVIKNLRADETIFLGKTNMDEFAMGSTTENSAFKATHNPRALDRVPGGSSGGAAAAVAADEAVFTLGSDTGGSIRQPAAFCGVVGMKPTYGLVSRYGLVAFASSLDQIGPLTKTVWDNALVLQAIAGQDPNDSTSVAAPADYLTGIADGVKGMKFALPKEFLSEALAPDIAAALRKTADRLTALGAAVEEVTMPELDKALPAYYVISSAEASSNLARFDGVKYGFRAQNFTDIHSLYKETRSQGFGAEVKRRILLGSYVLSAGYYDAYYKKALEVRALIKAAFDKVFEQYDAVLSPVAPTTAYKLGEKVDDPLAMYLGDVYTVPVNIAGLPSLSLPCGQDCEGLPIGLQLIGKPFGEAALYRAGYTLEQDRIGG